MPKRELDFNVENNQNSQKKRSHPADVIYVTKTTAFVLAFLALALSVGVGIIVHYAGSGKALECVCNCKFTETFPVSTEVTPVVIDPCKNLSDEGNPGSSLVNCSIVQFDTLSTLYLPYTYTPTAQYALDEDAAEQMAYDSANQILYSVGHTNVHVIDISNVTNPRVLYHSTYDNVDVTDVEVCGDFVYVAYDDQTNREDGFIEIYRLFNKMTGKLERVHRIIVGVIPDMIHPTADCKKLVVAVEAEPYVDNDNNRLVDMPGSVTIISFHDDASGSYNINRLGFEKFNTRFDELSKSGVRWVYRGGNNTFANDVEPEYITFNADESKAYICLQENNAIAVVDMHTEEIEEIFGLGFKNWQNYTFDASDRDGGFRMRAWPVYGMYQPDSIKFYSYGGDGYVITANEGDSKDYSPYFSEETRVKKLTLSNKFESNQTVRDYLKDDANLGRLNVATGDGFNPVTGEYDALYTFGARSFTIRRADTMEVVYDSGDDIERKMALLHPELFNNDVKTSDIMSNTYDSRSDNKGPETESIAMGHFNGVTLLIIGNERPGTLSVYSINERYDTIKPRFETMLSGIPESDGSWDHLYNDRKISMVDPEDIRFIPAADSPNKQPLLLVSGSTSGTISILQINMHSFDSPQTMG